MAETWRALLAYTFDRLARRLDPPPPAPQQLAPFFECLARLGFEPRHVIDIGANRGNWTRTALRYYPNAFFTLFEPQSDLASEMDDLLLPGSKIKLHNLGLGATTGEMLFTIHDRDDSCSFALSAEDAATRGFPQIRVPVTTLDSIIASELSAGRPTPELLKIDAEGWDLQVLAGAPATLSEAEVVLLEAGIMNKRFENSLQAIINRMDALGYTLFDFTDLNRTPTLKALWLVEAAFIRRGGTIDRQVNAYN